MNVKEFWKVILAQDENAIRKYFHKDAYINWHCTNEHFNVDEFIIANCEYPGDWDGVVERIERMNDLTIKAALKCNGITGAYSQGKKLKLK